MSTETINSDVVIDEFAKHLLNTAPIVETILKFLNARNLNLCASGKYPVIQLTAICGDSVQVASVIIHENIKTPEKAEECIIRLKQHNMPEENSFAIMFACVGRGKALYEEPDVESKIFRKHFPKTPLIGLFGNGEIGFEHCSREQVPQESPVNKRPRSSNKLYHAYTTVLVLISIT